MAAAEPEISVQNDDYSYSTTERNDEREDGEVIYIL